MIYVQGFVVFNYFLVYSITLPFFHLLRPSVLYQVHRYQTAGRVFG